MVYSHEHEAFWAPNGQGYTRAITDAGLYSQLAAHEIVTRALIGWNPQADGTDLLPHEVMVPAYSHNMITDICRATVLLIQGRG